MKLRDLFRFGAQRAPDRVRSEVGAAAVTYDLKDPALTEFLRAGHISASGAVVSLEGAMRVAAAWRCTHIIAGVCGNSPIELYRRVDERTRAPAVDHPLRKVLTERPNGWQTPSEFRKMLTAHAVLKGEAFGLKIMSRGRLLEIWPMHPDRVEVTQQPDMSLAYAYTRKDGVRVPLRQEDVLHLRGLTLDGVRGVGVIRYAREALGLSITTERAGAHLFKNGVLAGGILKFPNALGDEAYKRLKESIEEDNAGAENAGKFMILEEGGSLDDGLMSAQDAQFLETRKFERSDVAMFFGVPPHMIGDTEKSTSWGSGIEQQGIGFVTYTALDWFTMWEQAVRRDCMSDADRAAGLFVKIDARALMRGDFKARTEGYARALGSGGSEPWMYANEVRALEDLPPVPWGDERPQPASSPAKPGSSGSGSADDERPPPADD